MPLISIIIPAYNREKYIAEAVESVLAQDYPNKEIIVVDDGSTDSTAEIIKRYGGRVRYIKKENGGEASARNLGLSSARGELIAWLDSDDYYLSGKLSAQAKYLEERTAAEIVFCKYENFVDGGETPAVLARMESEKQNEFCVPTSLARKSMYDRVGTFDTQYKVATDIDYLFRMQMAYGVDTKHYIDIPYYRRRFHGENIILTNPPDKNLNSRIMAENLKKKKALK
jgi:glycosyltransferase involved in cell wall biosynthesis